jgi:hypothetical protein
MEEDAIGVVAGRQIVFHGDPERNKLEANYAWAGLHCPESMSDELVPGAPQTERQRFTAARQRLSAISGARGGSPLPPARHGWQQWRVPEREPDDFVLSPAVTSDSVRAQCVGPCQLLAAALCLYYHQSNACMVDVARYILERLPPADLRDLIFDGRMRGSLHQLQQLMGPGGRVAKVDGTANALDAFLQHGPLLLCGRTLDAVVVGVRIAADQVWLLTQTGSKEQQFTIVDKAAVLADNAELYSIHACPAWHQLNLPVLPDRQTFVNLNISADRME